MVGSGEDVGTCRVEELTAVVVVDVLVGGVVGVGAEAEVATDHDPGSSGATGGRPRRLRRGDASEQRVEPEQRRHPADAERRHPLVRPRGEPTEEETGATVWQRGEWPAGAGHCAAPGPEHHLEHVVENGTSTAEGET